jgi:hypothetical protein
MAQARRVVIDYAPRSQFDRFHERTTRYACIVAHRRAGKTVATVNDLIRRAISDGKRDARYAYIAPYRDQAKAVAWDYLKRYAQPIIANRSESELWVELLNGARIRLYGADNPDALRGQYLDGVVMDEVADMRPGVWGEILRPALSDRQGWAVFIGTPRGHDHFHATWQKAQADPAWLTIELRASQTGILPASELDDARRQMTADQFAQEYECSFEAAIVGAIYAKELGAARDEGRITAVPYDHALPVDTAWDLGIGDATAIWFIQPSRGGQFRVIDYYEATGEGLPHYAQVLQARGYTYGAHYAPHDIQVRELGSGKSRIETARALGLRFLVAPQQAIEDGIHAVQMMLPSMWFDAERCRPGLEALQHYRREVNERLSDGTHRVLKPTPVHDWSSHGADALRTYAQAKRDRIAPQKDRRQAAGSWMM